MNQTRLMIPVFTVGGGPWKEADLRKGGEGQLWWPSASE